MSLHELHPEELIDKAARGALDASERKQLDRHLAACSVCRFEMGTRDDFRAQDRMHEELFSDDAIDMIVGASLRGADARKAKIQADLQAISSRPRAIGGTMGSRRRWAMLLAVAMLLVSAQATARWLGIRTPSWLSPPSMTTVTTKGAPADESNDTTADAKKMAASKTKPTAPSSIPPETAAVDSSADLTTTVAPVNAPIAPASAKPSISSAPAITLSAVTRPSTGTSSTMHSDPSASALFAAANSDREQGKHVVATREYRELLADFPNAPEADLSRATLGRLLLDDGDAVAALPLFDAYLQKNETGAAAALREETMVNRATALERMHRSTEEADAWQALLGAYPQSLHAERARDRLKEIGAR